MMNLLSSASYFLPSTQMDHFLPDDLHSVLSVDSLSTSHPIHYAIQSTDDISSVFDSITYSKVSHSTIRKILLKYSTFAPFSVYSIFCNFILFFTFILFNCLDYLFRDCSVAIEKVIALISQTSVALEMFLLFVSSRQGIFDHNLWSCKIEYVV